MSKKYIAWRGDGPLSPNASCVCGDLHGSETDARRCAKRHKGMAVRSVQVSAADTVAADLVRRARAHYGWPPS